MNRDRRGRRMAIFGKILGGVLGFAFGGPLGALIGAAAGHGLLDRRQGRAIADGDSADEEQAGVVFALGVIALAAKVAKADGAVTRDEIQTFQRLFPFDPEERSRVAALYNEARRSADGFEAYAEQVRDALATKPELLAEVVDALYAIAAADGELHPAEEGMIARIGAIFGLGGYELASLRARHAPGSRSGAGPAGGGHGAMADAYAVLGVESGVSDEELRAAHRKLVLTYHPDKLASKGLPEEFMTLANDRLAAINAAYETVTKERRAP